jgi:predicted site-specific integrase-resolvase
MEETTYLTKKETAATLGVSTRTVDRYASSGLLTRYIKLNRIYFNEAEVVNLGKTVTLIR